MTKTEIEYDKSKQEQLIVQANLSKSAPAINLENAGNFGSLADEIIFNIFSLLTVSDLNALRVTTKSLNTIANDNRLWQALFKKDYGVDASLDKDCRKTYYKQSDKYVIMLAFQICKYYIEEDNKPLEALKYFFETFLAIIKIKEHMQKPWA